MGASDDELIELLSCHRSASCRKQPCVLPYWHWSAFEKTQCLKWFLHFGYYLPLTLSEADLGPYAWEHKRAKTVRSTASISVDPNPVKFQNLPLEGDHSEKEPQTSELKLHSVFEDHYMQYDDLRNLPRSMDVFRKIEKDPVLWLQLPRPAATAGRVLEHSINTFQRLYSANKPMTFKFGLTHDASVRFHNRRFGYVTSKDPFDYMLVLYATSNSHGAAFLEAALINQFKSSLIAIILPCASQLEH